MIKKLFYRFLETEPKIRLPSKVNPCDLIKQQLINEQYQDSVA